MDREDTGTDEEERESDLKNKASPLLKEARKVLGNRMIYRINSDI